MFSLEIGAPRRPSSDSIPESHAKFRFEAQSGGRLCRQARIPRVRSSRVLFSLFRIKLSKLNKFLFGPSAAGTQAETGRGVASFAAEAARFGRAGSQAARQGQPGTARHSQAQPGTARHSQAQPGTARQPGSLAGQPASPPDMGACRMSFVFSGSRVCLEASFH